MSFSEIYHSKYLLLHLLVLNIEISLLINFGKNGQHANWRQFTWPKGQARCVIFWVCRGGAIKDILYTGLLQSKINVDVKTFVNMISASAKLYISPFDVHGLCFAKSSSYRQWKTDGRITVRIKFFENCTTVRNIFPKLIVTDQKWYN